MSDGDRTHLPLVDDGHSTGCTPGCAVLHTLPPVQPQNWPRITDLEQQVERLTEERDAEREAKTAALAEVVNLHAQYLDRLAAKDEALRNAANMYHLGGSHALMFKDCTYPTCEQARAAIGEKGKVQ